MTTPGGAPAVLAEGLRKRFGAKQALDGIDLRVEPGTVFGMLGPNGAGKTTTVRVLTTLLHPDAGHATVAGFDVVRQPQQVRARIGLTGQYAAVDPMLTGYENLVMIGRLSRLSRRAAKMRGDELLASFDLTEAAGELVHTYSGGMRRRLDLWRTISELVAKGVTVLLTTQYLEEADRLADRIAVIDRGTVIAEGTPAELKARVGEAELMLDVNEESQVDSARAILERTLRCKVKLADATWLYAPASGMDTLTDALLALRVNGIGVLDASIRRPSLDEVFLRLTGSNRADVREAA